MKIKKKHIDGVLRTIHSFNGETGAPVAGLLWENITLGTKRRLQKISKELTKALQEYNNELEEVENLEGDKRVEELKILQEEEVEISAEQVQMSQIESIQTDKNYDFEMIELIAHEMAKG